MVELTIVDLRVQLVLSCLGAVKPAFSQGALCDFRDRLIRTDLDRRVLERTGWAGARDRRIRPSKASTYVAIGGGFQPFEGAGRVEDTFNLLGHAARKLVRSVADVLGCRPTTAAERARAEMFLAPSIKSALDVNWSDPKEKAGALTRLEKHLDHLERWVERHISDEAVKPHLATLRRIRNQDLEAIPRTKEARIREGVAHDRRVSIEDSEMRHGRREISSNAFETARIPTVRDRVVQMAAKLVLEPIFEADFRDCSWDSARSAARPTHSRSSGRRRTVGTTSSTRTSRTSSTTSAGKSCWRWWGRGSAIVVCSDWSDSCW
jgi:hypothetical protein